MRSHGKISHQKQYDVVGRIKQQSIRDQQIADVFAPIIQQRFSYDHADQLTQRTMILGDLSTPQRTQSQQEQTLHYDQLGQIVADYNSIGKRTEETFHYDPAGNLLPEKLFKTDLFVKHNQTTEYGTMRYSYDGFGRMLTREGHQGFEKQRFHYDSESRITKIELLNHGHLKAVEFEYDPLGRRIAKRAIPKEDFHQTETTSFGWIGMQMVHEHNDKTKNNCLYIYNDGSYEPLARIEKHDDDDATAEKISYYSNHINGCPDAMLDDDGNIVWIAKITTFGKAEKELKVDRIAVQQNLRYQGQYLDRETGLHYNTFRYYDPEIGRFTQQDPIGLAGGFNLYQYAPNMIHWIDPWGWAKICKSKKNREWNKARKKYWKDKYKKEIDQDSGKYSEKNMERMKRGDAPKIKVEVMDSAGNKKIKDVSIELHHTQIPNRVGTTKANEAWNLTEATPWGHAGMDPYRHVNEKLIRIINGTNSY